MSKIKVNKSTSFNWYVTFNSDNDYQISNVYNRENMHVVNLKGRRCSCKAWDLNEIHCQHEISSIYSVKKEFASYVSKWYNKDVYLQAYDFPLSIERSKLVEKI